MRHVYSWQLALTSGFIVIAVVVVFAGIQSPEILESPERKAVKAAGPLPHPVEGYENCTNCHGADKSEPYPDNHLGWANEICTRCHGDTPSRQDSNSRTQVDK